MYVLKSPIKLSAEAAERLQERWEELMKSDRSKKLIILQEGMTLEFVPNRYPLVKICPWCRRVLTLTINDCPYCGGPFHTD